MPSSWANRRYAHSSNRESTVQTKLFLAIALNGGSQMVRTVNQFGNVSKVQSIELFLCLFSNFVPHSLRSQLSNIEFHTGKLCNYSIFSPEKMRKKGDKKIRLGIFSFCFGFSIECNTEMISLKFRFMWNTFGAAIAADAAWSVFVNYKNKLPFRSFQNVHTSHSNRMAALWR